MASAAKHVALYVHPRVDTDKLMQDARSSDFLQEAVSGEGRVDESPLWHLIVPQPRVHDVGAAVEASQRLSTSEFTQHGLLWADDDADGRVHVVLLDGERRAADSFRVHRNVLLEAAARLSAGQPIEDYMRA